MFLVQGRIEFFGRNSFSGRVDQAQTEHGHLTGPGFKDMSPDSRILYIDESL